MCTAKGSDVRPGVPLASLGLRRSAGGFCVAGVGQCALPRARTYALLAFAWQAWDNVYCPMYAPVSLWRPLVSAVLPVAFAWHRKMDR